VAKRLHSRPPGRWESAAYHCRAFRPPRSLHDDVPVSESRWVIPNGRPPLYKLDAPPRLGCLKRDRLAARLSWLSSSACCD
jgi:hypothetical protein